MSILKKLFSGTAERQMTPTQKWFYLEGGKEMFEQKISYYRSRGLSELRISNFDFCPYRVEYYELRGLLQQFCPAVYLRYKDTPGQEDILLFLDADITPKGGYCYE